MILERCRFVALIFVASFVETNDALALPLFTRSFLSLSLSLSLYENALVEKWVFVMRVVRIYLPRIKYAHATTTKNQTNETTLLRRSFWIFFEPKIHFFSIDFLSLLTPLLPQIFPLFLRFCFTWFVPTLLTHFSCSCLQLSKKNAATRKNREVFLLTQIIEHTHT